MNKYALRLTTLAILLTSCIPDSATSTNIKPEATNTPEPVGTIASLNADKERTATPTKLNELEFDPSKGNPIAPEDILQEVTYMAVGGGRVCNEPPPPYSAPTIVMKPRPESELLTMVEIIACGWQENEKVTITIKSPNGKSSMRDIEVESDDDKGTYYTYFVFKPLLDDPEGQYSFTLNGSSGAVTVRINFRRPDGPRLYQIDENHLFLYGFGSKEAIRLFGYIDGKFVGWQNYFVDENGQLTLKIPEDKYKSSNFYVVLGEQSGEVRLLFDGWHGPIERSILPRPDCGGVPSRLTIGDLARVAYTDGANMRIRAKPGFSEEILTKVPEGTFITIMNGPKCADDSTWWYINTYEGLEGWMTEEQDGVYLLELYPK